MLVPGLGQFILGAYRRALVLLGLTGAIVLASGAVVLAHPSLDARLLVSILVLDIALLGLRVFAVVDAGRSTAPLFVAALVVLTVAPHAAAGYLAVRSYTVLDHVFASEEPRDVLPSHGLFLSDTPAPEPVLERAAASAVRSSRRPQLVTAAAPVERPWTTILLLGTDEGPGNWGARTDTIIVVALEHGTRRAVAFGIPRNLVDFRVGGRLPVFHDLINALYSYARAQPDLFPDSRDPGATALKLAVSRLLGVRVDYYALANLRGFEDLVDALGGVTIDVKERLHDSVTRASVGRAEAADRRLSGPHVSLQRPGGARVRAVAEGLGRLHAHGAAALLPERAGRPGRPAARAAELRVARAARSSRTCAPTSRSTGSRDS